MAKRLHQDNLKRTIGLPGAFGVVINQVIGGGIVSLTGVAIAWTGGGTPLAYILAALTVIIVSIPYASVASAFPVVGGIYSWPARIIDPRLGFVNMWTAVLQQCALSLYGLAAGAYLHDLSDFFNPSVVAVVIVGIFYLANLMGAAFSSRVGVFLTVVTIIGFSLFIFFGFEHINWDQYPETLPNGVLEMLKASALLTFATIGSFGVAELGREMKNPGRDIPVAMIGGTLLIGVLYVLISLPAVGVLPIADVANKQLSAVAKEFMPHPMWVFFVIGAAMFAIISTLNAQLLWGSKGLVAAVDDGWLPSALGRVNKRFGTPHWILTILFILGITPAVIGLDIGAIGTAAAGLVQIMLLVVLWVSLRARYTMAEAYSKAPFQIPLSLHWVLAILGTFVSVYQTYLLSMEFTPFVWFVILGWIVLGCIIAVVRYPVVKKILLERGATLPTADEADSK